MLMSKKELENKCKELELKLSEAEASFEKAKRIYETICNVKIFKVKRGKSASSFHTTIWNVTYVKIDMLNRKLYTLKCTEPERKDKKFKDDDADALVRFKRESTKTHEFTIDRNLDERLLTSGMYSFIVSNFEKNKNFKAIGFKDNLEFVKATEEEIIDTYYSIRASDSELRKYKEILKNL